MNVFHTGIDTHHGTNDGHDIGKHMLLSQKVSKYRTPPSEASHLGASVVSKRSTRNGAQRLTFHHHVRTSQVREPGCADLAAVRAVGAVRDEVHTHLALGRLNGRVGLTWRDRVALAEQLVQEVQKHRMRSFHTHRFTLK